MNRYYNTTIAMILIGITTLLSCKKSYLDTKPVGKFLGTNYYNTPEQALAGVVAAYSNLGWIANDPLVTINAASDDCYAGGGGGGDYLGVQAFSDYTRLNAAAGTGDIFWNNAWQGVYNANIILDNLPKVPGLSTQLLTRYTAESKFLRAYYYFELVRLFKNIPLILAPISVSESFNVLQADPKAVYTQMEKDLNDAVAGLPMTVIAAENGRATQGAAKALLGKVYLYDEKWPEAAIQLSAVNGSVVGGTSSFGYKLLANYGSIFTVANKFSSESIFEITRSNTIDGGFGNVFSQFIGPRDSNVPFYNGGYGFDVITLDLVNALKGDPRYGYTIINMDSLAAVTGTKYSPSYQNTGYFTNKYAAYRKDATPFFGFNNDFIVIRLADTYLMEAEALVKAGGDMGRAAALLNAVRGRVGLTPVSLSLPNIYKERRLELAMEGHRWYDLVRTGQAPTVLAFKGFTAGKNEILPIPNGERNNTKLNQNPHY